MDSNFGIKVVQDGRTVDLGLTEDNIRYFNFLSADPTLMIVKAGLINGGTYTHSLGYKPFFIAFSVDSVSSPTTFSRYLGILSGITATTTQITGLPTDAYVICFAKNY